MAHRSKALRLQPIAIHCDGGRAAGHDQLASRFSIRPGAHLVSRCRATACYPAIFARASTVRHPHISTWIAGFFVGLPAGIWDIGTLGDLTNIGTLFAFIVVSVGVIVLRRAQPERPRSFRVPWVPFLPMLSILCCLVLMLSLPLETWIRFVVWLGIGLAIYFFSGRKRAAVK